MIPQLYDESAQKKYMSVGYSYGWEGVVQQAYPVQVPATFVCCLPLLEAVFGKCLPFRLPFMRLLY